MDKTQIDYNVNQAICILNRDEKNKNIVPAIPYINKALELCESDSNLAYFITIKNIVLGLRFYARGYQAQAYLNFYKDLFEYLLPYFKKLENYHVNSDDKDEAIVINEICTIIFNAQVNFFSTLIKLLGNMGVFCIGKIKKAGKEHIIYHRSYCNVMYTVLEKYSVDNPTIANNCKTFRASANKVMM